MNKLGHRAEVFQPPLSNEVLEQLRNISDEWLTHMHGSEMHFSVGWFEDEYIRSGPILAIRTPEGDIRAFANIIPEYQRSEVAADMMRHRAQTENGTMDFLFVSLFLWAKEQGYATFNLGLSALSGIGEHASDPAAERALHYIFEHVNQFYNFRGLHAFKEKYHPEWSPRYLVFSGYASLPAVAMAMARAQTQVTGLCWIFWPGLSRKIRCPRNKYRRRVLSAYCALPIHLTFPFLQKVFPTILAAHSKL